MGLHPLAQLAPAVDNHARAIGAVFLGSVLLEAVRSFSNLYFPNTWQLSLGIFLLVVILLLPNGLGSILSRFKRSERSS